MKAMLLLLLVTLCATVHAAEDLQVELKSGVRVATRHYTLADLADVYGGVPGAAKQLAGIVVGQTPRAGLSRYMTRAQIERAIAQAGVRYGFSWGGAARVQVEAEAVALNGETISQRAAAHVKALLAASGFQADAQVLEVVPDVMVRRGVAEFRPGPITLAQALQRRVLVDVQVLVDGEFQRVLKVPVAVKADAAAWVARRPLPKGHPLSCDDVERKLVDAAAARSALIQGPCNGGLGRLRASVGPGQVLTQAQCESLPSVMQGDTVKLELVEGGVTIEARAHALADGSVGDRIQVRLGTGKELVVAQVVASGTVKISGR